MTIPQIIALILCAIISCTSLIGSMRVHREMRTLKIQERITEDLLNDIIANQKEENHANLNGEAYDN
jgi:hypothetical protein